MRRLWLLLLLIPAVTLADQVRVRTLDWAQPMLGTDLDNFYRLNDEVYRTGVVAAMYRMVFQDWPRARAIDEFMHGG